MKILHTYTVMMYIYTCAVALFSSAQLICPGMIDEDSASQCDSRTGGPIRGGQPGRVAAQAAPSRLCGDPGYALARHSRVAPIQGPWRLFTREGRRFGSRGQQPALAGGDAGLPFAIYL